MTLMLPICVYHTLFSVFVCVCVCEYVCMYSIHMDRCVYLHKYTSKKKHIIMAIMYYDAFKCLKTICSWIIYQQFLTDSVIWVTIFAFFKKYTQLCSHSSSIHKTLLSLCGHQQKALDCWWGGLTLQLPACTGRPEEWLELRWAEKCSLARLQNRWEGRKGKVRGGLGEGVSAGRESTVNLIHKVDGLWRKWCRNDIKKKKRIEAEASLCTAVCAVVRWGLFTLTQLTCELILPAG